MKPEKVLKLEARLGAMEYMIAHLFKMTYGILSATPEMIAQSHGELRQFARNWTFPEIADPAFSDLLAAELEAALDALLQKVEKACQAAQRPSG